MNVIFENLNPERCPNFKDPIPVEVHSYIMKKVCFVSQLV